MYIYLEKKRDHSIRIVLIAHCRVPRIYCFTVFLINISALTDTRKRSVKKGDAAGWTSTPKESEERGG